MDDKTAQRIKDRWYRKGLLRAAQIAQEEAHTHAITKTGEGSMACEMVASRIFREANGG